jgi:hypothetical protein
MVADERRSLLVVDAMKEWGLRWAVDVRLGVGHARVSGPFVCCAEEAP